jgi:hypothetical protein
LLILGTQYKIGQLVITEVTSTDDVTIGEIEKCISRGNHFLFIVKKRYANRQKMNYFLSGRPYELAVHDQRTLADYKPLVVKAYSEKDNSVRHRIN